MSTKKQKKPGDVCGRWRKGKICYGSISVARYNKHILQAKHPDKTFKVFRCKDCSYWHVGKL